MHNNEFVPPLTSIRGIAAMYVLFYHIHVTYKDNHFFSLFNQGGLGVDLFFVLSGYIMAFVYGKTDLKAVDFKVFYKDFIVARLARVYPLHIATLLFLTSIVLFLPGFKERYNPINFTITSFLTNILLIQNWGITTNGWNMVSWSVSAEWFMYLIFPFMLFIKSFVIKTKFLFALVILIITTHFIIIYSFHLSGYGGLSLGGMIRVFFEFSLGFSLYFVRNELKRMFITFGGKLGFVAAIIMLASVVFYKYIWFLFLPATGILIVHLGTVECHVSRFLSQKMFIYFGNISFSLYMWHWIIINIQNWMRDSRVINIQTDFSIYISSFVMVILSITIAHYSFLFIEKPTRRLVRQAFN